MAAGTEGCDHCRKSALVEPAASESPEKDRPSALRAPLPGGGTPTSDKTPQCRRTWLESRAQPLEERRPSSGCLPSVRSLSNGETTESRVADPRSRRRWRRAYNERFSLRHEARPGIAGRAESPCAC